jgi:hypothetical protein
VLDAVSRREFKFCVDVLNQTVEDYFPCLPCYGCGYFWCFTTCGLSLCFSEPCTKQVRQTFSQGVTFVFRSTKS